MDIDRLKSNVFPGESGGDYNARFGYSNRPGGLFEGINLTDMTVDEALQFANPSGPYGQWVKGQVGRVATPMGAFQVVGSTLRAAKEGLGLTGKERMDQATQDRIGQWIYQTQGPGAWEAWGKGGGAPEPRASTQGGQQMAIMEQQPQGLLGALGIQRRDPTAQGETALPFYQREAFGNTLDNLQLALNRMTLRPDPNLAQQIGQRRQERTSAKQRNATAAWLRSQGREDLAAALESGAITGSDAARVVMTPPKERAGIALGDRIVDPVTGQVIYEPSAEGRPQLDKDQLSALNTIRDDVRAELAPFEIVKSGYNNITTFYENPGSTSDYALAVAFAKILDPGSVAREGEVQAVQNAGARVPALGQALKNAITGEGALTPQVRQEIAELATQIYQERAQAAQTTLGQYSELANRAGIPPEFVYAGQIPEARPVVPSVPPPAALAQGITQQMWDMATPEEKAAWSK